MKNNGLGENYSGSSFTTVTGNFVTEKCNRETKGIARPFRNGFSTDLDVTSKLIKIVQM